MSSPPLFHFETGNVPLPLEDRLSDLARLLKISPFGRNDKNGRYSKLSTCGGGRGCLFSGNARFEKKGGIFLTLEILRRKK